MMSNSFSRFNELAQQVADSYAVYRGLADNVLASQASLRLLDEAVRRQVIIDRPLYSTIPEMIAEMEQRSLHTAARELLSANKTLANLAIDATTSRSLVSEILAERSLLREPIAKLTRTPEANQLLASLEATKLLQSSLAYQNRLLDLEPRSFGNLIGVTPEFGNTLKGNLENLTRGYRGFVDTLNNKGSRAPLVATDVSVEYSLELDVLESLSAEDTDDTASTTPSTEVEKELSAINPELLRLLVGAKESLRSDNPDKARHITTSVRELFTQLMHHLAPDSEVKIWAQDPALYFEGKLTRRARLLYICREISCDPLNKFIEADVKSALSLIDALNSGTHSVVSRLTNQQLTVIVHRMESQALFLLKLAKGLG